MADFSVQSTELSAPQGAGANVVKPATAQLDLSGISSIFKGIADIQEGRAAAEKNKLLKEYSVNRDKYAQAIEGGADLSRVNAQRRADAARFRASNPGLIKDFDTIDKSYLENTQLADAEDDAKMRRELRKENLQYASTLGYSITPSTSAETLDAYAQLAQSVRAENTALARKNAQLEYASKLFGYNKDVTDEQRKTQARETLSTVVPQHLVAINSTIRDMSAAISSDPTSYPTEMIRLKGMVSGLLDNLVATKESLPGVYDSFASMAEGLVTNAEKYLNPNDKSENKLKLLQDQVKMIIEKSKLALLQNAPGASNIAATTQLFGDNVLTQLGGLDIANRFILPMIDPSVTPSSVPVIVNQTPDEQKKVFKAIIPALENAVKANTPQSLKEGQQLMSQVLDQARALDLQENVTLDQIAPLVDFLAHPSTRTSIETLKVDPKYLNSAVKIMERYYYAQIAPAIETTLNAQVDKGFTMALPPMRGMVSMPKKELVNLADNIHIEPTATGIKVVPKSGSEVTETTIKGLTRNMETVLNKGLMAEANLSGKPVQQVWQETAHIFFPKRYPPNFNLKVGDVIKDQKTGEELVYIGGFGYDRASYRKR